MSTLRCIDHVHVFVADRAAAAVWYSRVLGLVPQPELAFWAEDGGPLTLSNAEGTVHVALFERPREKCRSTIAFGVGADDFIAWKAKLEGELGQALAPEDHQFSWSIYFSDPDGNPFEITTYERAAVAAGLAR